MRWTTPPNPEPGTIRVRSFFAWLYVTIGDETRWLERVTVREERVTQYSPHGNYDYWQEREFIDGKDGAK